VLFQLVKVPPNALPEVSSYPLMTVALMIQMGSLVAPFMEVAGLRGYFQIANRQEFLIGQPVLAWSTALSALVRLNPASAVLRSKAHRRPLLAVIHFCTEA
jgi:hypothetical protein